MLLLECIVWKSAGSFNNYLKKSIFNLIDIPMCLIQMAYSIHRIIHPNEESIPEEYSDSLKPNFDIDYIINMSIVNFIIILFHLS